MLPNRTRYSRSHTVSRLLSEWNLLQVRLTAMIASNGRNLNTCNARISGNFFHRSDESERRNATHSCASACSASCNGVFPLLFIAFRSAPYMTVLQLFSCKKKKKKKRSHHFYEHSNAFWFVVEAGNMKRRKTFAINTVYR